MGKGEGRVCPPRGRRFAWVQEGVLFNKHSPYSPSCSFSPAPSPWAPLLLPENPLGVTVQPLEWAAPMLRRGVWCAACLPVRPRALRTPLGSSWERPQFDPVGSWQPVVTNRNNPHPPAPATLGNLTITNRGTECAPGIQWAETKEAVTCPALRRTGPRRKDLSDPNVRSAKVEKPLI